MQHAPPSAGMVSGVSPELSSLIHSGKENENSHMRQIHSVQCRVPRFSKKPDLHLFLVSLLRQK